MSDEILMYLPSNVDLDIFADNTRAKFITNLPQPLNLDENWHAALQALSFDYKLPQVSPQIWTDCIIVYTQLTEDRFIYTFSISLPQKYYTMQTLLETLSSAIPDRYKYRPFLINKNKNVFNLEITEGVIILFEKNFFSWCYKAAYDEDYYKTFFQTTADMLLSINKKKIKMQGKPITEDMANKYDIYVRILRHKDVTTKNPVPVSKFLTGNIEHLYHERLKLPKFIRVSCDLIQPCITSSGLKTEIASLPSHDVGKSYFFEVARNDYFPLSRHHIERIKIELNDHNFEPIKLASGQATIATLKLKKMNRGQEIIARIGSNDSNAIYPFNTTANFRVELDVPIVMDESWKVALSSIHFTNLIDYDYFLKDSKFILTSLTKLKEREEEIEAVIDFGKYFKSNLILQDISLANSAEIVKSLTRLFHYFKVPLTPTSSSNFLKLSALTKVQETENEIEIDIEHVELALTPELAFLLGATDVISQDVWKNTIYPERSIMFEHEIDVTRMVPNAVLLYCDIIKPVIIGPTYAEILRTIEVKLEEKGNISFQPKLLEWLELSNTNIKTIHFQIKDISGRDFQLQKDSVALIVLKFQKQQ
jgi:hypothetical protein